MLHTRGELIAYLRDDKPDIPFPGLWDLPGGGREGTETPAECAMREVEEEFGLRLCVDRVRYGRRYPSPRPGGADSYFLAAALEPGEIERVAFGSEGQRWRMMRFDAFLDEDRAVPDLQVRLRDFLATFGSS